MAKEPIAYRFQPANPGESLASYGIPARDLTQADWDRLTPAAQYQALAVGPSGKAMYAKADAPKAEPAKVVEPPKATKDE